MLPEKISLIDFLKTPRKDDYFGVMKFAHRFQGGRALAVLGGPSGKRWRELEEELKPDIVIGANGVNAMIRELPFWVCTENIAYAYRHHRASKYWSDVMEMFWRDSGAKVKLINFKSWNALRSAENCVKVRRYGFEEGKVPQWFSFREYGMGLLSGWNFWDSSKHIPQQVGTTGTQLIHFAGILGCSEVHTVGFDLVFRDGESHHWYPYPDYRVDHFRKPANFVEYGKFKTQAVWVEGARFLGQMIPYMERDGLEWSDHSEGLFRAMQLSCVV